LLQVCYSYSSAEAKSSVLIPVLSLGLKLKHQLLRQASLMFEKYAVPVLEMDRVAFGCFWIVDGLGCWVYWSVYGRQKGQARND
jgi:16S rRNA U516 pseudouridylate synthase RsuA-like enzyme